MLGIVNTGGAGIMPGDWLFGGDWGKSPLVSSRHMTHFNSEYESIETLGKLGEHIYYTTHGNVPYKIYNMNDFTESRIELPAYNGYHRQALLLNKDTAISVSSYIKGVGYNTSIADITNNKYYYIDVISLSTGKVESKKVPTNMSSKYGYFARIKNITITKSSVFIRGLYGTGYYHTSNGYRLEGETKFIHSYSHDGKFQGMHKMEFTEELLSADDKGLYIYNKENDTTMILDFDFKPLGFSQIKNYKPRQVGERATEQSVEDMPIYNGIIKDGSRYVLNNGKTLWNVSSSMNGDKNNTLIDFFIDKDYNFIILQNNDGRNNGFMKKFDFMSYKVPEFDLRPWWER